MKKRSCFAMAFVLLMFFSTAYAAIYSEESTDEEEQLLFRSAGTQVSVHLPAALQVIDEDAFEGTALREYVDLNAQREENTHPCGYESRRQNDRPTFYDDLKSGMGRHIFNLPSSLRIIGDEAFEGIASVRVNLPDTLLMIGERAFVHAVYLKYIYIPESVKYVGSHAFEKAVQVTFSPVRVMDGNWKPENAPESHIPVDVIALVMTGQPGLTLNRTSDLKIHLYSEKTEDECESLSEGRCSQEIDVREYKQCIAFHIQGRSPPVL